MSQENLQTMIMQNFGGVKEGYYGIVQEPITRSLHLPYKPLESTLSDEKLFIEIVFAQNLSCPNA